GGKPRLHPAGELGHCAAGWSCESRSTCVSALRRQSGKEGALVIGYWEIGGLTSNSHSLIFSFPKRRRRSFVRAFMGVVDELWRFPRWTQSPGEELANTISHGIGLLGVDRHAGTAPCCTRCRQRRFFYRHN